MWVMNPLNFLRAQIAPTPVPPDNFIHLGLAVLVFAAVIGVVVSILSFPTGLLAWAPVGAVEVVLGSRLYLEIERKTALEQGEDWPPRPKTKPPQGGLGA